jgi:hypothetical protein
MKHIDTYFHTALRVILVAALLVGCKDDAPDPALPNVDGLGDPNPISTFQVTGPANGLSLSIKPAPTTVTIEWEETSEAMGKDVRYEWLADEADGDFSSPLLVFPSDNDGRDPKLTVTYEELYDGLGDAGVAAGAVVDLKWTVRATAGSEKRLATTPRTLSIRRGGFTFIVHAPANTPSNLDVYLAGTFGVLGAPFEDWKQPGTIPALKLTRNDDGTYSITLGLEPGTNLTYKYFLATAAAPSWNNGEQRPNLDGTGSEGMPDRHFTVDGTIDTYHEVVSLWEGYFFPYVMFKANVPDNTPSNLEVFVAGAFSNLGISDWNTPGENGRLKMNKYNDDTYYNVFPKPADGTTFAMEYKYALATTQAPSWDNREQEINSPGSCGDINNHVFSYDDEETVSTTDVESWLGYCP